MSRNRTPQPWQGAGQPGGGLALPQQNGAGGKAGKGRAGSEAADGGAATGGGEGGNENGGKSTDVDSLMDAVGASGVDLGAEEEGLRATNERMHAQAMAAQQAAQAAGLAPNPQAYAGIDRSRKQDFIDPQLLAECVKKVAAAFQLKTLEPDTIPLIALATRHRLMSLVNASIAARDHRQSSSHFRVPPFVAPSTSSRKRRRRDPLDPDIDDADAEGEADEDEEMLDLLESLEDPSSSSSSASKRQKVPAWDTLVYDDPERYLSVLERVEREEERRKRRERMMRDQKEQEAREFAEAMAASEAARLALEAEGKGPDGQPLQKSKKDEDGEEGGEAGGGAGGKKKKDTKGKGKGKLKELQGGGSDAPSTPGGKTELGKDGKPKKKKATKKKGGEDTPSGAATPGGAPGTGGAGAKNLAEDIKKRLTDQTALRSLGGQKFSWLNAGMGSPSPAGGLGTVGGAGGLPKPKFASANSSSSLPPPSFAAPGGGANGLASTSGLNPANNGSSSSSSVGAGNPLTTSLLSSSTSTPLTTAQSALTTSRLNVAPMHDAQRTQLEHQRWEAGHHVVEIGDLLFAMERERGMGVGRGSGRSAAIRGRAGITRGGYAGRGGR